MGDVVLCIHFYILNGTISIFCMRHFSEIFVHVVSCILSEADWLARVFT